MKFPAHFEPDAEAGGFVVTFRDIPEAITQGDTEEEALAMAADVLLASMEVYFDEKRPVPAPSKAKRGERLVALPASAASKVLLLNEMLGQQISPSELARRLDTSRQDINRLVDLKHATKIDRIEEALAALGKSLELAVA